MARKATEPAVGGALTVSALARRFGLARSTLLHYHRIHLFKPSGRSPGGYRIYGPEAVARLARICELRQAGLALRTIRRVLDAQTPLAEVLEEQVGALNRQVSQLRKQQRVVLSLLELSSRQSGGHQPGKRTLSRETWTDMFRAIGMSDEDMRQWHCNFEQSMPDAHADFLHSLGLEAQEIQRIRAWSRG
jgi:DNA-binding transcriptional MerR regulator